MTWGVHATGVRRIAGLCALVLLAACTARGPAPVREGASRPAPAQAPPAHPDNPLRPQVTPMPAARPASPQIAPSTDGLHRVQRGDTLYSIAFVNNLDYREIAAWNRLESPDRILVGQVLRLTPPPGEGVSVTPLQTGAVTATPLPPVSTAPPSSSPAVAAGPPTVRAPLAVFGAYSDAAWAELVGSDRPGLPARVPASPPPTPVASVPQATASPPVQPVPAPSPAPAPVATAPNPAATVERWQWPAEGVLAGRFGAAGGKGIDIVAPRGSPVRAAAPGRVVYSGSGLRGYGQLLIVRHDGEYLSAYAHNDSLLVKEGDTVQAGQIIARMGDTGADRVKLHFEIRRHGKPLDPLTLLPERS